VPFQKGKQWIAVYFKQTQLQFVKVGQKAKAIINVQEICSILGQL
jgi:multidrug resistance efflux pump